MFTICISVRTRRAGPGHERPAGPSVPRGTSTHAPSVERCIRTFKDNLHRRLDGWAKKRGATQLASHVSSNFTRPGNLFL